MMVCLNMGESSRMTLSTKVIHRNIKNWDRHYMCKKTCCVLKAYRIISGTSFPGVTSVIG
jgi:hypothetical protein